MSLHLKSCLGSRDRVTKEKRFGKKNQWIPVEGRGLGEDGVLGENFPFAEVFKPIFENQEV